MKPPLNNKAVTLLEVLISIILMGIVMLGFFSIDFFSRYHVNSVERRSKIQNEMSYVLDDMTKNVSRCRGDNSSSANWGVRNDIANGCRIRVDNNTTPTDVYTDDQWVNYVLSSNRITKQTCNSSNASCSPVPAENLNTRAIIVTFVCNSDQNGTGADIQLVGRYDATQAASSDNPEMRMQTRAYSFSASSN